MNIFVLDAGTALIALGAVGTVKKEENSQIYLLIVSVKIWGSGLKSTIYSFIDPCGL